MEGRANWPSRLCNEWVSKITDYIIKITVHDELKRSVLILQKISLKTHGTRLPARSLFRGKNWPFHISGENIKAVQESCPLFTRSQSKLLLMNARTDYLLVAHNLSTERLNLLDKL